jgi:IS1 family transposase
MVQNEAFIAESVLIGWLIGWVIWQRRKRELKRWWKAWRAKPKRPWTRRPGTPDDCPDCRLARAEQGPGRTANPRPWADVKSERGRPKEHDSEGYACMNPGCEYYKVTDARMHALRWDGQRNACEATDQWECGACGSKHTARLGTPMYRLKTASEQVKMAVHMAMKGMNIADISEVLEHSEETITRWLERSGGHSERLHDRWFRNLILRHIQLDELYSRVRRWAKRAWVWTAEDAESKAWLTWHIGGRKQADAHHLLHRVRACLARGCVPAFTSDGLRQDFYAITAHFGQWVSQEGKRKPVWQPLPDLLYGQFRKVKTGRKLKHVYTKMLCGERSAMTEALQAIGLSGQIQTAFVERLNLTLRHLIAALHRRTWSLANQLRGLRWRVALGAGYYNFCRCHASLQLALPNGHKRRRTPAMALGITGHPWSVKEFITHPVY